jgi:hypothetical protein
MKRCVLPFLFVLCLCGGKDQSFDFNGLTRCRTRNDVEVLVGREPDHVSVTYCWRERERREALNLVYYSALLDSATGHYSDFVVLLKCGSDTVLGVSKL